MEKLKKIWNSRYGNFIFFLFIIMIGGIYFYIDRPFVKNQSDLIEINGTFREVDQILVYSKKIIKSENDSTYHIFLNEYPCKFQVSYSWYDSKEFYSKTLIGDKIKLHIAQQEEKYLKEPNRKIRSFSLSVNSKEYLSVEKGLAGFGTGIFELVMIFLPLIIITLLIYLALKR